MVEERRPYSWRNTIDTHVARGETRRHCPQFCTRRKRVRWYDQHRCKPDCEIIQSYLRYTAQMKADDVVLAELFRRDVRSTLNKYLPRIVRCLESLSEEEIWWRPN